MGLPCRWGSPKSQGSSVRRARLDKGPRLGVVRCLPASLLLEQLDSLAKTLTPGRADSLASPCSAPSICGVISEMKASFLFVLPGYSSLLICSFCKYMLDGETWRRACKALGQPGRLLSVGRVWALVVAGENCGTHDAMASVQG